MTLRPAILQDFGNSGGGLATLVGHNFSVHRLEHSSAGPQVMVSDAETLLIFPECGGRVRAGEFERVIPSRSLVITPAGRVAVQVDGPGRVYALTTGAVQPPRASALNARDYIALDPRVTPVVPMQTAEGRGDSLRVYAVDEIPFPAGNARIKFLQTATMSVNWVEYEGPRDRTQLSPHSHADFEQGSLAVTGEFVHHLRTPWASNANQWRDDQHLTAGADSLLIVAPEIIHTSEGVGPGKHILIDVFAPARADFVAKGWVHNAADYVP